MLKRILMTSLALLLPACAAACQAAVSQERRQTATATSQDSPLLIYQAFEDSLGGEDIQIPLGYLHQNAVISFDYLGKDGLTLDHVEVTSPVDIKGLIQIWMNERRQQDTQTLKAFQEGSRVYFWLEFHFKNGAVAAQDGYAEIKEGKIYRYHFNPIKVYQYYESPYFYPPYPALLD